MRTVKRIIKIHRIQEFEIYCLFNNGESRIIDFKELFNKWKISEGDEEHIIANSADKFGKVELIEGTLTWNNVKTIGYDESGNKVEFPYQLDPIVLYENSIKDTSREIELGLLIKQTRHDLGLTQEELANKSGTTKHYISRIENNRTGIELSTLKRIIEGGFGKRMQISIT